MYIFLIPTYEPNNKLITLLKEIPKEHKIVIVDDGSGNDYQNIFDNAKKYAHVISYESNMGKGYALKKGLTYIKNTYKEYIVVTIDSDGQHKINDALKLCKYVEQNRDTLALGMRTWDKDSPIRSRIGNKLIRTIYHKLTGLNIYDTQTGLRAFSNRLTDYMLKIPGNRFEYEMNALLGLNDNHIKYHEIPIETIYEKKHHSHYKTIKDSFKIYKECLNYKKRK